MGKAAAANTDLDVAIVAADADIASDREFVVRARQQTFGFTVLGALCCLAAAVFTRWSPAEDPARWFWSTAGSVVSIVCLIRAHRVHGGSGADRDASPYYGIFAGVASGALLLLVLAVEAWVLPGVFFVIAAVLAFMAWIEQSAIGMTAAVCVAIVSAGSGVSVLGDAVAVGFGTLALGAMLLTAAVALGQVHDPAT